MTTSSLRFTKMHGLGNDFVIINALDSAINLQTLPFAELADRHTGIGFDQLLVISASQKADFFCRIYNADGSEAEQCGNGLRCVARYLHEDGIHTDKHIRIETLAGIFSLEIQNYDHIRACMGIPDITHPMIELHLPLANIPVSILSLGNPHAIARMETLESLPLEQFAAQIAMDKKYFPNGVNVGFMQVLHDNHIRLRTFERGAGETFACGSNACAAAAAGITLGLLQPQVRVDYRYGSLTIEWKGGSEAIYMTGPAARVYAGEITVSA
jgi:diaminopimelate epimerase